MSVRPVGMRICPVGMGVCVIWVGISPVHLGHGVGNVGHKGSMDQLVLFVSIRPSFVPAHGPVETWRGAVHPSTVMAEILVASVPSMGACR